MRRREKHQAAIPVTATGENAMNEKPYAVLGETRPGICNTKNFKPEEYYEKCLNLLYSGPADINVGCGAASISKRDTVRIFLKFEEDKVVQANFQTRGSAASSMCGFFAAQLALRKTRDELTKITGETIIEFMGGLPEEDRQCAVIAAESIKKALQDYGTKKEPPLGNHGKSPALFQSTRLETSDSERFTPRRRRQ
jgi:nitrogen fixation NifU-like protein